MPTPDELAAQIRQWVIQGNVFADEVAALDDTPEPQPEPAPLPVPPPDKPAAPDVAIGQDGRPVLTWPIGANTTAWEVHDLFNPTKTLQATVTEPRSVRSPLKAGQRRRYGLVAVGPGGRSDMSDTVDVPPAEQPEPLPDTPGTARYPGDIVGPSWYLTLPTGTQGSPDTVHQPQLATYTSKYFELTPAGDGVVFRCWHGGVTTSGSANPRSELREMSSGGADKAAWSCARGTHTQTVVGQVNRLTKVRPHVVLHQIHGADDDVTVWRLEGSKLWITDGDNPHGFLVDDAFQLGQRYELKTIAHDGEIGYWYNGKPLSYTVKSTDPGCYFKAGCYAQTNPVSAPGESTDEYAETVVYSVTVTHAG